MKCGADDLSSELGGKNLAPCAISDIETVIFQDGGGFCLGTDKSNSHKYYIVKNDTHVLCLGATRSGKSRTVNLPTVILQALAGENMVNLDVKGEMYFYTAPFLERLGYEVITLDFNDLAKSAQYNFLQPVIDAVNIGDIAKAMERARDIVTGLVPEENTNEKLWVNGERAVMTCAIMAVVYDNRDQPQYQNIANVFYFLAKMC
ncbi:MAG: type IV secretory system conjugative DNA transfer family protein, partial [Oscillospiraceae bacterium]